MADLILVTGATGLVGSHLVPRLTAAGFHVRALVQPGSGATDLSLPNVEVISGDVRDADSVRKATRGCRQVFHLASSARTPSGLRAGTGVDVAGARNMAAACLEQGVERLIHASTAGVYGLTRNRTTPLDEESPTRPNSHYRADKLRAEAHLLERHERDGLPVVIARLTDLVGERAITWLGLCRAVATSSFRLIGTGRNVNQLCHVSDAVAGLELCAQRPGIEGRCYLFSGDRPIPIAELLAWIAEELGVAPPPRGLPSRPFMALTVLGDFLYRRFGLEAGALHRYGLFVSQKAYDISRARNELGFEPRQSVREGVRDMLRWYRGKGHIQGG